MEKLINKDLDKPFTKTLDGFEQNKNTVVLEDNRPSRVSQLASKPLQRNSTGLPDDLKSGMENLSGMSLDNVRVHYNSPKPATVQAHAYAQGTDIHLASGQEKHLPHELGHVVQQAEGRVKANRRVQGVEVNDSASLENEATQMGKMALQRQSIKNDQPLNKQSVLNVSGEGVVQGLFWEKTADDEYIWHWGPVINAWWQAIGEEKDGYGVYLRKPELETEEDDSTDMSESASGTTGGVNKTSLFLMGMLLMAGGISGAQGAFVSRRPLQPFTLAGDRTALAGMLDDNMPTVMQGLNQTLPFDVYQYQDQLNGELLAQNIPDSMLSQLEEFGLPDEYQHDEGLGLFHEHFFFDNGTDLGFFESGFHEDLPEMLSEYSEPIVSELDEDILNEAISIVRRTQPYSDEEYSLTGDNCQMFVQTVLSKYRELGGVGDGVDKTWMDSTVELLVALDDQFLGHLESEVQSAVDAKISSSREQILESFSDNPYAPLVLEQTKDLDLGSAIKNIVAQVSEREDAPSVEGALYEVVLKLGRAEINNKIPENLPDSVRKKLLQIIARKIARYIHGMQQVDLTQTDPFEFQYPRGGTRTDGI